MDAVLKVVQPTPEHDVLRGPQEGDGGAPKPPGQAAADQASDAQTEEKDDPATDDEPPPPGMTPERVRKKYMKLLTQRRELRDQVSMMTPDANVGFRLNSFARENDLSSDDIVMGMSTMAALRRGDYQSFYQQIAPYVRRAQEVLGLVLPQDLDHRVQQGGMTEQAARELALARHREQRAQELARTNAVQRNQERLQFVQTDVQRAVTAFEERIAANDPDYRAKADAIRRTAQALLLERGSHISSVQEALDIVQHAHQEVTNRYRQFLPQPRSVNPPPNGNSQQPTARAAPRNLMEAALAGLENARRMGG